MNNIFVYCEIEDGKVADVSLELLTKARALAQTLGCKVEALAIGHNLQGIETQLAAYGHQAVDHIIVRPGTALMGLLKSPD